MSSGGKGRAGRGAAGPPSRQQSQPSQPRGGGSGGSGGAQYGRGAHSSGDRSGSGGDRQRRESSGDRGGGSGGYRGQGGGGGGHRGGGDYRGGGGYRGGGDRGRGGGYGAREQLKKNVRDMCEIVDFDNQIMTKLIEKPGYGVEGKKIKLIANYFQLEVGDKTVYHYDVDIKFVPRGGEGGGGDAKKKPRSAQMPAPDVPQRMRRLALKENMAIIKKLSTEWDVFRGVSYVYDALKNIYTTKMLKFSNGRDSGSQLVSIALDGFQTQTYEVTIQYTLEEINLSTINHFYEGMLDIIPQQAFQALEIILKYMPIQIMVPIGRSLYSPLTPQENRDNYMGESAVMAYGHYQSVRLTEVGPAVVIDRKATVLHYSGTLIQFIVNLLHNHNIHDERQLERTPFTEDMRNDVNKHLSGLKIFTTHINGDKRKCTVDSLIATRPEETRFQWIERDNERNVVQDMQSNIAHYFREKYKIRLKYGNIPCILLKGGQQARHLPVEICHVYPDQPLPRRLISGDITAQMVKKSGSQPPLNRFGKIAESAEMIAENNAQIMEEFDIHMSINPMQVPGRVLFKPKCDGDDYRVKEPKALTNWFFVLLSRAVIEQQDRAKSFLTRLISTAREKGITISEVGLITCNNNNRATIENVFKTAIQRTKNTVQMIMFCIPPSNDIYHNIKYYGDMVYGVITQCVRDNNVLDTPSGYHTNLLLKINSKLDGKNSVIPEKPRVLRKPSIIIGVDVSHPAPADRMLSSVAACVGSYDKDYSKYSASITVQARSRDEIITEFGRMIKELLTQFGKKNKFLPSTIIIFRDGVSESQFEIVLEHEYALLVETCSEMNIKDPKITFVIVQKRHHTRLLPLDPEDGMGRPGNVPPGTVVDSTITNPVLFEYYLCSHFGLQGTSRPTKYVVLRDDNHMTADEMQKLSYYLCFTYARCNKSISIPTPVMYAHLAAYRSKLHIVAQDIETEEGERGETQEIRREREVRNAAVLNANVNVNEQLKARLYYC